MAAESSVAWRLMDTFRRVDAAGYASFRPRYLPVLHDRVLRFHAEKALGRPQQQQTPPEEKQQERLPYTLLDVGTGTGQLAIPFAARVARVVGVDVSAQFLQQATASAREQGLTEQHISFHESQAEHMPNVPDGSVDIVTVAEALHWFDTPRFFNEVRRVICGGDKSKVGTLAVAGYADCYPPNNPEAKRFLSDYVHGTLGPFWDARRAIIDNLYRDIEFPFEHVERHYYPSESPSFVSQAMTLNSLQAYLRTWSAHKNYMDQHAVDPTEELIDRLSQCLRLSDRDAPLELEWEHVLILAKVTV